jgi:ankyrin repeat protein
MVQALVENGAKLNVRNKQKRTPLHILVQKRHADLAKWLVSQVSKLFWNVLWQKWF